MTDRINWSRMSERKLSAIASESEDWRSVDPSAMTWKFVKAFPVRAFVEMPISDLDGVQSVSSWVDWIREERATADDPSYYDRLLKAYRKDPIAVGPVVIAVVPPGKIEIGDGWHRIAMAVGTGMKSIPAIVGEPR